MKSIFRIEGMDCSAEEQVIRNRLTKVAEVEAMSFDLVNRRLTVEHDFPSDQPVREILAGIGLAPDENCEVGCAPQSSGLDKKDWLLGAALLLAIGAEIIVYLTGKEKSIPVISVSLLAMILGGIDTFKKGLVAVKTFTLNINFLMCIAVIGAVLIGSYPEAAMVMVLFAIAERIESFALQRASNAVQALMQLAPEQALVKDESGNWTEVIASSVSLGQIVRVKPGDRIALDGKVVEGRSSVDQSPITGESIPVEKQTGDSIFAGTINGEGVLEFEVTGASGNTTLDRIIKTVQEAQGSRAATQRFVDDFARYYTPAIVVLAILMAGVPPLLFAQPFLPWLYKALVLLVIACPCALVISTPVTVVSGLAAAAKMGILVKGGAVLEAGHKLTLLALDKTGTLTQGKPEVIEVVSLHGVSEEDSRRIAASLDSMSAHPIAQAIVRTFSGEHLKVDEFKSLTGKGVSGKIGGTRYLLGNHRLVEEEKVCGDAVHAALKSLERKGATTVILADEQQAMAIFVVADVVRQESIDAIKELHQLGIRTVMLTGDNEVTAQVIGKQVGIDDIRAELLPESKLEIVKEFASMHRGVGMVGDGVNDAPALAASTVGFAMGAIGTDTAIETADVALMEDDLRKVPRFIQLSSKTRTILAQNITFAIAVKVVFFALALFGKATLWMAVFADMGASLIVVANGLRMLKVKRLEKRNAT